MPKRLSLTPEQIRHTRTRHGFTQTEFARLLQVTSQEVSNWECGRYKPRGPARILLLMLRGDRGIRYRMLHWMRSYS